MYTMTPKIFYSFFGYEYPKTQNFMLIFKSVEIFEKKVHTEKVIWQKLLQISIRERENPQFCTLFSPVTFLLANF
jgi:hypothetical protein